MTTIKNIHPVYFNSFVGTWKRADQNGSLTNGFIKFKNDCTFEDDGSFNPFEGTVNGDVDEISVEDDGNSGEGKGKKGNAIMGNTIRGTAVLTKDSQTQKWAYRMGNGRSLGIKVAGDVLEFRTNSLRVIYVGNLPLSEEQGKKPSKKKVKA